MTDATRRSRAIYRDIALYSPDRTPCCIDLSDNTNAWGMPPASRDAISDCAPSSRYPSVYAARLKDALSDYIGLPPESITTGCGSDDVLDSAIRAFADSGDRIAFPEPTFPMIPIFARMNGLSPVPCALEDTVSSDARIIYLCSPNNPTGLSIERGLIEEILRRSSDSQIIIVDEAYAEFAETDVRDLVDRCDRLIVTRTMSKAFGLAGLRVGYAFGHAQLIAEIEKSRGPYKVSAIAELAAVAALTTGRPWVDEHIGLVIANRRRFEEELFDRGLLPLRSSANFVFFAIERAAEIARAMRSREVAVRAFDKPSGLRITIGPWPQMIETLSAFDEARRECE